MEEEEKILEFWKEIDAFNTQINLSNGKPPYSFYDGPPFATGLPHYGHLLAGTIKDIVTRYATQTGHYVERRFGWDCHGLPVEYEIDKKLNIKGKDDVLKLGIDKYNQECRSIVMRYSGAWRETVERIGRWIDFDNDYKTLNTSFMESVWWVFKELYEKNQVYRGVKIMPFSTACTTPLSNFEAAQNYKDVNDPAIVVSFPLVNEPDVLLLAWTTTPWTLPSNLALCTNPNYEYIKIKDEVSGHIYILLEKCLNILYKDPKNAKYVVLEKILGKDMKGWEYIPLFEYYVPKFKGKGFIVLNDTYVTDDSGTGIVHQAPAFGEDDHRICLENKIITEDGFLPCPVDEQGLFTSEDADKNIQKLLKQKHRLIIQSQIKHNWNVSRNRYWGTPIPLWIICIGSLAELEELSGCDKLTDIHRDKIDHITIPSKKGKGPLKRVEEPLRFKEEGVKEVIAKDTGIEFKYNPVAKKSENVMDRWILACTQSLIKFVREEME
ncbi:9472_t:CDS:10, partial [Racocetra fulgida]